MSSNSQIFFNLLQKSKILEISAGDFDLSLSHTYEDDRGLVFSNYKCELCVYKFRDRYAERVSRNFLNAYSELQKHIDYSIEPMLVSDVQVIIGYIDICGKLKTLENNSDSRTLVLLN